MKLEPMRPALIKPDDVSPFVAPARNGDGPGRRAAVGYLDALIAGRAAAAGRLAALAGSAPVGLENAGSVALWGLGSDWRMMLADQPALADLLRAGRLTPVDAARRGEREAGREIVGPEALACFAGWICPTPSSVGVRGEMRQSAEARGFARRFVDPYDAAAVAAALAVAAATDGETAP